MVWAREYRLADSFTRVAGLNRQVLRGSFMFHFIGSLNRLADANLAVEQAGERSRVKLVFLFLDAPVECLRGVILQHGHHALREDWAGVDAVIHQVNRAPGGY